MTRILRLLLTQPPIEAAPSQAVFSMTPAPQTTAPPERNSILRLLRAAGESKLIDELSPVVLRFGDIIYDAYEEQKHVYFPFEGVVSLLFSMKSGRSAEIAIVGRDGMVGLAGAFGCSFTTSRAMVQVSGFAFRLPVRTAQRLMSAEGARNVLLRYSQYVAEQASQTAICNRYHSTHEQLCKWILQSVDMVDTDEIEMTQQLMAEMLGARREAVSATANALRAEGLIVYSRGVLRVLDRKKMEAAVCECYRVLTRESQRLLPRAKRESPAPRN